MMLMLFDDSAADALMLMLPRHYFLPIDTLLLLFDATAFLLPCRCADGATPLLMPAACDIAIDVAADADAAAMPLMLR